MDYLDVRRVRWQKTLITKPKWNENHGIEAADQNDATTFDCFWSAW